MKLIKDVTDERLKPAALDILNRLKVGDRVFGNPAQGLKITQKKLEEHLDEIEGGKTALDYVDDTGELRSEISMLKAGITGEENLAEFVEAMIKADPLLQDCIVFASLSDPDQNSGGDDYISDSDFIVVYGTSILIMDAKNIVTTPDIPIYLDETNILVSAAGKEILEIHSSVGVWKKIFSKYGISGKDVHGVTVIVNKKGALIWRNPQWHNSEVKPIHISELVDFLHEWVDGRSNRTSLNLLTIISKMQIREEKSGMDFTYAKRTFGL